MDFLKQNHATPMKSFLQEESVYLTYIKLEAQTQKTNNMAHQHTKAENQKICCTETAEVNSHGHADRSKHNHESQGEYDVHVHGEVNRNIFRMFLPAILSFLLLITAIVFDNWLPQDWFVGYPKLASYLLAYAIVGFPVIKDAIVSIAKGNIFSEFLLMTLATIGAFAIDEYPEAVAVMLFYSVGEFFQSMAISHAKKNIQTLLDQRPDEVTILQDGQPKVIPAPQAKIGDTIQLKPGEKLGLDGELLSEYATFDTAALTGESKPQSKQKGDHALAGMINLTTVTQVRVTTAYADSKLSRILDLVQNATAQRAPTEVFIRKFAKVYTPAVVGLAVAICLLPALFVSNYIFNEWLYKALVFLVISCPCALVISIPLGYFGGIGAASKNGILFKGSNFLDTLANIQHIVMDKTGTMTEGVFEVQEVNFHPDTNKEFILQLVNAVETQSTHPVATAIHKYVGKTTANVKLDHTEEIPGHGMRAIIQGKEVLVGNFKLLDKYGVSYESNLEDKIYTTLAIAYDNRYVGYMTIADVIKTDASKAIQQLQQLGVQTTMLSGDKKSVVQHVAEKLGIREYYGNLLPEDKVNKVKELKVKGYTVAFIGDGVNDAPVVAVSDVGIAMGGLGSDVTIETADVVIQDDKPSKLPVAIRIGKKTKQIVWQNITLAFVVKVAVLILGAGGIATMWEAVFADVGVALLAIVNAIRIQKMNFQ